MKNKVVIVTGAARGLGQKYAIELSNAGALVVAADINSCEETKKLIEEKGSECLSIELDITNYNNCEDLVAKTLQNFKKIAPFVFLKIILELVLICLKIILILQNIVLNYLIPKLFIVIHL